MFEDRERMHETPEGKVFELFSKVLAEEEWKMRD